MRNASAINLLKILLVSGLAVLIVSWQPKQSKRTATSKNNNYADTSKPGDRDYDEDDFDLGDLDVEMKELHKEMLQLNNHLKEIDLSKIQAEIKASLDSIDFKKINLETQRALKSVDWNKINNEVNQSLKSAQLQIEKINSEQIKANLEQVKVQLEKQKLNLKLNMEKMKEQMAKGMKQLHENMYQMKTSFVAYKKLTNALQKDGLIDTAKGYSIKFKDGILFINGKKQPTSIVEKYKAYLPDGKGNFTLKKDYDGEEDNEGEEL